MIDVSCRDPLTTEEELARLESIVFEKVTEVKKAEFMRHKSDETCVFDL
jgi:hypothetical protein